MSKLKLLAIILFISSITLADHYDELVKRPAFEISPSWSWNYIVANQYPTDKPLPYHDVTLKSFFTSTKEDLLLRDSKRSVQSVANFRPYYQKLLFPNGICLLGKWKIDDVINPYSGHFRPGSEGVVISRAAVALGKIDYESPRTLAISGKLFPTSSYDDQRLMRPANFLVMETSSGVSRTYLTESNMTNAPVLQIKLESLPYLGIALAVSQAFERADVRRDVRQLYPIAELEENLNTQIRSPKWMRLKAGKPAINSSRFWKKSDFRQEVISIIKQLGKLEFEIQVADTQQNSVPHFKRIGSIQFEQYSMSNACDHSLHFQHPPYNDRYPVEKL